MRKKEKQKIVGIKIDQKQVRGGTSKTYYYKTTEDLEKGDRIRVKVPSGGNPRAIVVVGESKKKHNYRLKELDTRET